MIQTLDDFQLSPIQQGDAWKICDFMVTNHERLKRYFPNTIQQNLNPTLSQYFVEEKLKLFNKKEELVFTLKHIKTRKIIGLVSIIHVDWSIKHGELAYCIDYNFESFGITSKAVNTICKYAFTELELERLQIVVFKENTPSLKVANKNGFIWKKTLEEEFTPNGEQPLDMELYELNKQ